MRETLKAARRIVVKAGTSMLTGPSGRVDRRRVHRLAADLVSLRSGGRDVALVSSGAIAFGMDALGLTRRPKTLGALQACAAVGQGRLMHAYSQAFDRRGLPAAQMLLTRDGLESRSRFLAARRTFEEVFKAGGIPVVNENDTVATEEIAFGDNDVLSVHTAHLIRADLLIVLSDVDGFHLKDGSRVRAVGSIEEIDRDLVQHLRERRRETTVGGMGAKLEAARKAMRLGIPLLIVDGAARGVLARAAAGDDTGTLFSAAGKITGARKRWIAFTAARKGTVVVDGGAVDALARNKSLLPSGVRSAEGAFEAGDIVEIAREDGGVIGRGVAAYACPEIRRIAGKRSAQIEAALGRKGKDEVIHRDDIVLWN
ncbi:MAG: glutamate 5-kinase [Elusimicrobia bacterium CG_4_9_14_3_um_filter_62_55]|nr:MAG: glutamate 5-kinase [Elusimicrobia bacterium CG22_combo_CG10-13_8_21_14_all_63_91]PJA18098.1 MAG: glutamate 5-kinase [Elusimicrobia bacterium CG_4_10_14_0_2_um_filter_63_34]PJB25837.1 MAG: glutamate 5-kinase [Elusimicrobia bacterium CG_4_9_14_3_um_filter_62_55]